MAATSERPASDQHQGDGAARVAAVAPLSTSLAKADDPFILEMMGGRASPLTITRAAVHMAARKAAMSAVAGTLGAQDLDGLKKTLQELRSAEFEYIDLEKQKGKLFEEEEVREVSLKFCANLVRCLTNVENALSTEVELWLADEAFRALSVEERRRKVREWAGKTCRVVRDDAAEGFLAMIEKARKETEEEAS